MLDQYAQEISETISKVLERSVIITDTQGVIIGAPAKERLGEMHTPSLPVMKYGKMTFDDADAARRLGVWYPGATVPIYFQGKVVGSAAIAGEPETVCKFAMLIKSQIESMLREKFYLKSAIISKKPLCDLVNEITFFDPQKEDPSILLTKAGKLGYDLELPRISIAIVFSNFRDLDPMSNEIGLPYQAAEDPFSEEISFAFIQKNILNILKKVFSSSQDICATTSKDKFVILRAVDPSLFANDAEGCIEQTLEMCEKAAADLREHSIDTTIGVGHPARNLYELPFSCDNAWQAIAVAEKLQRNPGVFSFRDFLLEQMLLSARPHYTQKFLRETIEKIKNEPDGEDLIKTFVTFCRSFFNKKTAAEQLNIHRNTLTYRLNKISNNFQVDLDDFHQVLTLYLALMMECLKF